MQKLALPLSQNTDRFNHADKDYLTLDSQFPTRSPLIHVAIIHHYSNSELED
jgi:hypothetical protein